MPGVYGEGLPEVWAPDQETRKQAQLDLLYNSAKPSEAHPGTVQRGDFSGGFLDGILNKVTLVAK